jgi:hypothetical protein
MKLPCIPLPCPGVRSDEGRLFLLAMNLLSFAPKKEEKKEIKLNTKNGVHRSVIYGQASLEGKEKKGPQH